MRVLQDTVVSLAYVWATDMIWANIRARLPEERRTVDFLVVTKPCYERSFDTMLHCTTSENARGSIATAPAEGVRMEF